MFPLLHFKAHAQVKRRSLRSKSVPINTAMNEQRKQVFAPTVLTFLQRMQPLNEGLMENYKHLLRLCSIRRFKCDTQ